MNHRTRLARVVALLVVALLASAGCASIPKRSEPKVVKRVDQGRGGTDSPPVPPRNLGPLGLVRNFVNSTASPENEYAAARQHLTPGAGRQWQPSSGMLIVDDVNTVPVPSPPDAPETVQMVSLRVSKVGRLLPDQSFVPEQGRYETVFRVERQRGGQWRIANPPPELVVSRSAFTDTYIPVPVYFLDQQRDGVVPDRRYVIGQPASTLPARVIELLLAGPSQGFRQAMGTALPPGARTATNVSESGNGALVVNFRELGDLTTGQRRLIAAQVVLSLQGVSNARVRLKEAGTPLLPRTPVLRPSDVAAFKFANSVRADVAPLAVTGESLVVLNNQAPPTPGRAGSGRYQVTTAGRSADGSKLAVVERTPRGGVGLRIGSYGAPLSEVGVSGSFMTRPSWRNANEVWTVVDGRRVVRAVRSGGRWRISEVDAKAFAKAFAGGKPITALRVSRDGTRVAGVVGGQIVVAGVDDSGGKVALGHPRVLTGGSVDSRITGVEWLSSDSLVAITDSRAVPVVEVTVDGFEWTPYASANLVQPLNQVTVGPGKKVVVADSSGLWRAGDQEDLWRLLQVPVGGGSIPFYPG